MNFRAPSYEEMQLRCELDSQIKEMGPKYYSELNEEEKQLVDRWIKLTETRLRQDVADWSMFDILAPFRSLLKYIKK